MVLKKISSCLKLVKLRSSAEERAVFMEAESFWQLIHLTAQQASRNGSAVLDQLNQDLHKLKTIQINQFFNRYNFCVYQAYQWKIYCAATIIHQTCNAELFLNFLDRCILKGKFFYHNLLTEPDFLAIHTDFPGNYDGRRINSLAAEIGHDPLENQKFHHFSYQPTLQGEMIPQKDWPHHFPELIRKFGLPENASISA